MTNIRNKAILSLAAMISLFVLSGCESGISSPEEPASSQKEYYFYKDDIQYVRLFSENIEASYEYYYSSYDPDGNPKFEKLVPLYEDIPQEQMEKDAGLNAVERDWKVFEHRLSEVHYNLKVHHSLEQEIERIVQRLLVIDDVIPACSEMFYDGKIKWLNQEVFEKFINENIDIEIIGKDPEADYSDLVSGLSWQVYSGGCFANYGPNDDQTVCARHMFNVWLADLSGTSVTVWDMKYVEEPGCGELLPMYKADQDLNK